MKWKLDFHSIKFKMWGYFILFAALILLVLWLLQIVFLQNFYQQMKTRAIIKTAQSIITEYGTDDFENNLQHHAFESNMMVLITDMDDYIQFSSDMFGSMGVSGLQSSRDLLTGTDILNVKEMVLESDNGTAYVKLVNKKMNTEVLLYGSLMPGTDGEQLLLYVASPLDPIDSTTAILQTQLIIVSIISLVLALILAFFISKRLSKPVEQLTNSARELASGNYDVKFQRGNYSEISELAGTLNYATQELSKTNSLRKELIANVSHDLRTPLTMIKMYAEMVRDLSGDKPAKRSEHLNIIINETDRLSTLVNDILDLSKIESGTAEMRMSDFSISQTIRRIAARFDVMAQREGYAFRVECPKELYVRGDEGRIEQVVYNLVSNAVNYTGEDKQVFIRLIPKEYSIRFEVSDTGKGIPPEQLADIWERYYRSHDTHKRAIMGTGLGLSIVRNILAAHQAAYGVDSTVGQGSTFWFELPAAEETAD